MRAGVIVAGGRSTRFGEADKAVADLAGVPMLRRVADRLAAVVDDLVVNCRADQRVAVESALDGVGVPVGVALDETPDRGPVAGVHAGLRAVGDRARAAGTDPSMAYAAVVACDLPFLDAGFVDYLFDRATGARSAPAKTDRKTGAPHDGAVPQFDGRRQPLHAVYRVPEMADACSDALEGGDPSLDDPLGRIGPVTVDEAEVRAHGDPVTFRNLNTRESFDRAAKRLRE